MDRTTALILGGTIVIFAGIILFAYFQSPATPPAASNLINYSVSDKERPKVELSETRYDFGKIPKKPPATHDFAIKNIGQKPLQITEIKSSCDCTSAILKIPGQKDSPKFSMHDLFKWTGEIPPGETALLLVIYDPLVMNEQGEVYRAVYFKTNDPEYPEGKVDIKMEVQ